MHSKRVWIIVALGFFSALPTGNTDNGKQQAQARRAAKEEPKNRPAATGKAKRLSPWESVDASFNGCSEGICGTRGRNARATVQPGAKVGDYTYCLVSGAVFQIKNSHHHADVNGTPVYFCCEGCARYFAANRASVLALRGNR